MNSITLLIMTAAVVGAAEPVPFWPTTDQSVMLVRGDRMRLGQIDADGNFVPYPEYPPRWTNGMGLPINSGLNSEVYEHRSGRLIRGTMVAKPNGTFKASWGVFVPEIDSTIIDLRTEFDVKKPDRMVYNLQETVGAFWTAERKKQFPDGLPAAPTPPAARAPDGFKLVPFRDAFPDDLGRTDLWYARVIGGVMEIGHLSEEGEFLPDYGIPIFPRTQVRDPNRLGDPNFSFYYNLPVNGAKVEEVLEYRSGRLIEGTLYDTGNFIPKVGSKVRDVKDYDVTKRKDQRRIYNLPGRYRPIKK